MSDYHSRLLLTVPRLLAWLPLPFHALSSHFAPHLLPLLHSARSTRALPQPFPPSVTSRGGRWWWLPVSRSSLPSSPFLGGLHATEEEGNGGGFQRARPSLPPSLPPSLALRPSCHEREAQWLSDKVGGSSFGSDLFLLPPLDVISLSPTPLNLDLDLRDLMVARFRRALFAVGFILLLQQVLFLCCISLFSNVASRIELLFALLQ